MNREEAIKIMYSIRKFYSYITPNKELTAINMAIEALKAHEWIPCSEKLPKECDGHVLVSEEDGQVTTGLHSEFSNMWYIGDMCGVGGCKVIAWMPLPEPYKPESEEA